MEFREKYASDFRADAREALRGKWIIAAVTGLIATLLSAAEGGPSINFSIEHGAADLELNYAGQTIFSTGEGLGPIAGTILAGGILHVFVFAVVLAAVYFVLGSVVEVGYSRYNLELVGRGTPAIENLFGYFPAWKNAALTRLFKNLRIFLGMLLLIVPGIVMSYSYAMTGYILAEWPELSPGEALTLSHQMMEGNRWRLFCLELSFIGWELLCGLLPGIGRIALRPYKQAAIAAFYREVSGAQAQQSPHEPWEM